MLIPYELLHSTPEEIDELEERYSLTARSKGFTYDPKKLKARIGNHEKVLFCFYSAELYGVLVYLLTNKKVLVSEFQSPKLKEFVEIPLADIKDVKIFTNTDKAVYKSAGYFHSNSDISIIKNNQALATILMPRGTEQDIKRMSAQILQAKDNLGIR